jgi:DNA-binding NtrC family response regulator
MTNPQILIVDDEENILHALKRLFRKENYQIFTATSAEEGLKIMDQQDVDLIISDLKMPGTNGVEFFAQTKEKKPEALRIMLTGHADLKSVLDAIDKGEIYRFLLKPWDDDEFKLSIKQALEFYYLQRENEKLNQTVSRQNTILRQLENDCPGITSVKRDRDGSVIIDGGEVLREPDQTDNS